MVKQELEMQSRQKGGALDKHLMEYIESLNELLLTDRSTQRQRNSDKNSEHMVA